MARAPPPCDEPEGYRNISAAAHDCARSQRSRCADIRREARPSTAGADCGARARHNRPLDPSNLPGGPRSEEHTSELQSLMRISYAVFCLKKKTKVNKI